MLSTSPNPRLQSIKASTLEGAKAGLTVGVVAGFTTKLVGRRVPLFHGRFRQYDLASHVLVGGLSFCAAGAAMAGRDFFRYAVDLYHRSPNDENAELVAAERVIRNVTGYRATVLQNEADVVNRFDEAFASRQAAIQRYHQRRSSTSSSASSS